ncbi:MAG TPA: hypothetical protein VFH53_09080 [Phycisphaerae bacterium]|nr:hypothetical protein [Phycisphaerae bacterium]
MTTATEGQPRSLRRIPVWGWILGALFFPPGIFIVLAVARALAWRRAIVLALLAYGLWDLMIYGSVISAPGHLSHEYSFLGVILYMIAVGQLQYAIGQKHGLWSERGRRMWKIFGYTAAVLFALGATVIAFMVLHGWRYPDFVAYMSGGGG